MIPCQRHLFDIPDDVAYLNCAYMAPLMHAVRDAGLAALKRKCRPWEVRHTDFFSDAERARALFAGLVNATADDIALIPAASYGIATAAANLALAKGQEIVVLDEQFPSNLYAWRELAKERDARLVTVPRPADDDWTGALVAAIGSATAVVACGHIHWTDGSLVDLAAVGTRCREVGAALVIDATQSLGAVPLDIAEVKPDFLVAATYKSLLGPYGMGFCYVAPERREGRPLEHNWIDRKGSEDFTRLVDYQDAYQPGARRYDFGERGNFSILPMTIPALEQILAWGPAEIEATIARRTESIAQRAAAFGVGAVPRARRSGYCLGLRVPGGVPQGLTERLAAAKVHVSVRGYDAIRVTPHLWVSDRDEDRFIEVLGEALAEQRPARSAAGS